MIKRRLTLPRVLIMALLINTKYSIVWPVSTLYMHQEFHASLTAIGFILMCYSLLNAIGSAIAGQLFDKIDPFIVLVIGVWGILFVSFIGLLAPGLLGYFVFLLPYGFIHGWALTVMYALVSYMDIGKDSRRDFNLLYLAVNIGLVVGTGTISFLYNGHGIHRLMVVILILALIVVAVATLGMPTTYPRKKAQPTKVVSESDKQDATSQVVYNTGLILRVFATLLFMWICYSQWMSNLSVYFLDLGFKTSFYSRLWVVNGIGIILIQLLLLKKKIFRSALLQAQWGISFLICSFILMVFAKTEIPIVIAMILLTTGEALYVPSSPVVVDENTPAKDKGRNQGLVNVFSSLGKALGPFVGGLAIDTVGYCNVFIIAVGILFVTRLLLFSRKQPQHKHS